ncbi:Calx-beta domain-containing protein [Tautonia plasticadhaerens]|uniref:Calx-beta domain protein n=1 Tax=Tautonia plasticadhaerens TaxID=2527974 RepID=A0A518H6Q3_9BACT|nr:Calx-beta domain-containing protein [Tautonia plasticadhaerens]QDV36493.1 Calx-beta domain protein [Tautonia plasticadhaerens]
MIALRHRRRRASIAHRPIIGRLPIESLEGRALLSRVFFDTQVVRAAEPTGSVELTLRRFGPPEQLAAEETFPVSYGDETATSGVDYQPTPTSVTFAPGEESVTFSVPILPDQEDDDDETFTVTATGDPIPPEEIFPPGIPVPPGFPPQLNVATTTVRISDSADITSPTIAGLQMIPARGGHRIAAVRLTFSEPMDPALASNPASYALFAQYPFRFMGSTGSYNGTPIAIRSATYEPASNSVLLQPARQLPGSLAYVLRHAGPDDFTPILPLTDLAGNPITSFPEFDAFGNGQFSLTFARGRRLLLQEIGSAFGTPNGVTLFQLQGRGTLEFVQAPFLSSSESFDPDTQIFPTSSELRVVEAGPTPVTIVGRGVGPRYLFFSGNAIRVVSPVPVNLRLQNRSDDPTFPTFQVSEVVIT